MKPKMFPKIDKPESKKIFSSKKSSFWSFRQKAVFSLVLTFLLPCQAGATASYGQASDLFTAGAGARSMAMGGAFTGLADDASASYFNPAGLAFIDEHQLMVMHAPLFIDSNYNFLSSAHPFGDKYGSVAFSDSLLLSSGFEIRDKFNNQTGNDSFNHNAIFASYAHKLTQKIAAGGNVKFIQQKVASFSDNALGFDLGAMYKASRLLSVGLALANVNSPEITLQNSPDVYRPITRAGLASEVFQDRLTLTADVTKLKGEGSLYAAGLEFSPNKLFALRTGYNANRSYTLGLGLKIKTFHIDYAFSDTDIGVFNKVSFTWLWHNIYKTDLEPPTKEGRAVYPLQGFENKVAFHTTVPEHIVARWDLKITDKDGQEIRTLSGDLRPPENIVWDARNAVGEPVIGGMYNYTFDVYYKNGKSWTKTGDINLHLPNNKVEEEIDMTLQLNGAKESELGMNAEPANEATPAVIAPTEPAPAQDAPALKQ